MNSVPSAGPAGTAAGRRPAIRWGYAGVYPGDLGIWEGDVLGNKLAFMREHGFASTGFGLADLDDPATVERLAAFARETGFKVSLHPRLTVFDRDPAVPLAQVTAALRRLEVLAPAVACCGVTYCVGAYHRFLRAPSLAEQLARLTEVLRPLAAGCAGLGLPCGIENHGDYYCADLVQLCERVPHLGIFLDTGNCFLIGEQPGPACELAAPHVMGVHFKDHRVYPDPKALTFVVKSAVLGEGDVGLREIFAAIMRHAPDPARLVMQWELLPPAEIGSRESIRRSWEFCRGLEGAA